MTSLPHSPNCEIGCEAKLVVTKWATEATVRSSTLQEDKLWWWWYVCGEGKWGVGGGGDRGDVRL